MPPIGVAYCSAVTYAAWRWRQRRRARSASTAATHAVEGDATRPRERAETINAPAVAESLVREMENSAWVVMYMMYAFCSRSLLEIFPCIKIGDDEYSITRLRLDLSVDCSSEQHAAYHTASVVLTVLTCAGVPLALLARLFVFRNQLDSVEAHARLGFLYEGYHANRYGWEVTVLARKLLIAVISVFYGEDEYNQLVLVLLVTCVGWAMQMIFKVRARSLPASPPTPASQRASSSLTARAALPCRATPERGSPPPRWPAAALRSRTSQASSIASRLWR